MTNGDTRPEIRLDEVDFETQATLSVKALTASADLEIFSRERHLVAIRRYSSGRRAVEMLNVATLRAALLKVTRFTRHGSRKTIPAPLDLLQHILAATTDQFPRLVDFAECPPVAPDGRIITKPGYDRETLAYYAPAPGFEIAPIPSNPSIDEIAAARHLVLTELLGDFPFVDSASRAGAVAMFVSSIARSAIAGPVPMFTLDKPQAGTGATFLAELAGLLSTGERTPAISAPPYEEEWRKMIPAVLAAGPSNVLIDNLVGRLRSPALASALTATHVMGRLLGRNDEAIRVPQRAVWTLTGNNIQLGHEFLRRTCLIALDAKSPAPWVNRKYRHADLLEWAYQNRAPLVAAILTFVSAWRAQGRPQPPKMRLGGFESWERTVGGILFAAGIPGLLENTSAASERLDEEGPAWERLLQYLLDAIGKAVPFTTAQLSATLLAAPNRDDFPEDVVTALSKGDVGQSASLARVLRSKSKSVV